MVHRNPKFDLNKKPADFYSNDQFGDTALRLECFGHGPTIRQEDTKSASSDRCRLVLGLGRTPSVCSNDRDLVLKLSLSNQSATSKNDLNSFSNGKSASVEVCNGFGVRHHVVDEGSTSAKWSGGYMPSLILAPRISVPMQKLRISEPEPEPERSGVLDFSGCSHPTGCSKAASGKTGLCITHGGGNMGVAEGGSGKWRLYGGGFCAKSVHDFCVDHDGGKRRVVAKGTESACGRTNCCVEHGGGKRYKSENCTTSTDICKAHGGARRYVCGGEGKYGSMVPETEENKNGLFGTTPQLIRTLVSNPGPGSSNNHSLSCSSVVSTSTSWLGKPAKRRQMIPPQVLVPSSMKSSSSFSQITKQSSSCIDNNTGQKSSLPVVPEGRVHGGSLLSLLRG